MKLHTSCRDQCSSLRWIYHRSLSLAKLLSSTPISVEIYESSS